MWIKLKCAVSGPRYTYKAGQEVDHPDENEARRWISVGVAEAVALESAQREPETASQPPAPEVAAPAVIRRRRTARPTAH